MKKIRIVVLKKSILTRKNRYSWTKEYIPTLKRINFPHFNITLMILVKRNE